MQVITTHLNADFDGLASMIAASRLYPEALLCFSGSQEKNLRDFIAGIIPYEYDFTRLKQIDLTKVTRLIVVDTRIAARIGPLAACLDNPGISLHLYDHHPNTDDDMHGDLEVVRNTGSTTTLFTEIFQEKKQEITADEATILALGIYEDTGSLSHLTTCPEDLMAAAWLLGKGAKLDIVSQFITYELTTVQVELLHKLRKTSKTYTIRGIPLVVLSLTLTDYIDDFSLIVRRFMVMENLDTIFTLVCMAGRIYFIARSRIAEVNVGEIARDLGGGGHATAASATVKNMTLIESQEKLIRILHRHIRPQSIAREMMTHPVISISANTTINEVYAILTRYGITAMPVMTTASDDSPDFHPPVIAGTISRREVGKAIHHELGHLPVSEYMTTDIEVLALNGTLSDIEEIIIENFQRLIPIVDKGELVGIITRTDLLNMLVNDPAHLPRNQLHEPGQPARERMKTITPLVTEYLKRPIIFLLRTIGEVAEELQFNAYAVGGFVRDLLLKHNNLDIDIVIEGDGILFARTLADKLNGRVRTHEKFFTATLLLPDGMKLDIATARLEYYEYPAALPTVELSSLKLDLYRRDFSINAMALHLNPSKFGTLIDYFSCQNDLKDRAIKVLHNLSFVEDPTRIFRAIRFEKRLDFRIVQHTRRLIQSAVHMNLFGKSNDPRFLSELKLIFNEENPLPAVQRLAEFELFQFLWPDLKPHLKIDRRFLHILTQTHRAISWFRLLYLEQSIQPWKVYILAVMSRSKPQQLFNFCNRFAIPEKISNEIIKQKITADKTAHIMYQRQHLNNSETYWLLQELNDEGILYLMATARRNSIKKAVSLYVTTLKQINPILGGKDLKAMGYSPGPVFTTMLTALLGAKLDGKVKTIEDEQEFIRQQYPL